MPFETAFHEEVNNLRCAIPGKLESLGDDVDLVSERVVEIPQKSSPFDVPWTDIAKKAVKS